MNQSRNFSTSNRRMQRNFGNDLTSFRRQRAFVFVSPLREEISFEDEIGKKRDNTVPVACKRKEAYVPSTGTGRCACYGSTISIRLFHSRREKEGTNVVIHLWEEDFTHRSSLSLCVTRPAGFAFTATHAMCVLRISEPRLSDRWPTDIKSSPPPFDDLESARKFSCGCCFWNSFFGENTVFQWFPRIWSFQRCLAQRHVSPWNFPERKLSEEGEEGGREEKNYSYPIPSLTELAILG